MADNETLTKRLTEAEEALHQVQIGGQAVVVGYDGHRTEYSPANAAELHRYIISLRRQLGLSSGGLASRPVRF